MDALRKRVPRTSMLNFDIRADIVVGFSLHWTWIWLLFWSSLFYSAQPRAALFSTLPLGSSLEPLWNLSFLGLLVSLAVLLALVDKKRNFGNRKSYVVWAAIVTCLGTAMVVQGDLVQTGLPFDVVYSIGAIATGVGTAVPFVLWGEMLTKLGARQTIVYFVSATIVSALLYFAIMFLPPMVGRLVACALPTVEMVLFWHRSKVLQSTLRFSDDTQTPQASTEGGLKELKLGLAKLLLISAWFGFSYGIMKGLFITSDSNIIELRNAANALALILGSVAIYITMAKYRMDFGRLTYQIAMPLMAAGFLFFPLSNPANLFGFGLHQFGYQYFYTIIWALWPVFAQRLDAPDAKFACVSLLGVQGGQFVGSLFGAFIINTVTSRFDLAMIAAVLVFVTLVVPILGLGNDGAGSDWKFLRPFDQDQPVAKYKRSIQKLGQARGLTPREMEVFELLAHGRNCAAISKQLVISEGTAKTHIKNVYRKFAVHSQQALLDMVELDAKNH